MLHSRFRTLAACVLLAASPALHAAPADGGGVPQAAAAQAASATAVQRTRIPPSATVNYRLSRGGIVGSGLLDWRVEYGSYSLRLEGSVPIVGTLIVQTSSGKLAAGGLAPLRYTDKRFRRDERVASFDRAAGLIRFSNGKRAELPLPHGVQDRLSVMLQLAAIANGWTRPPAPGSVIEIPVVGARGDLKRWMLRFEGRESVATRAGAVPALRFLRQPEDAGDTRAEFWLDPAMSYLPVRARLTDGDGDALELLRMESTP